jgi:CHAT domain-containing protein
VVEEMEIVARYFPPGPAAAQVTGHNASRATIRKRLPTSAWVHLACHGLHNPDDPTHSAFLLYDGPLTVADLAALRVDRSELAFLSACHTATSDKDLTDEAIHLAGAMQFLGYQHVIASLWAIDDRPASAIANTVYSTLTATGAPDPANAAVALHRATQQLRTTYPDQPLLWAQYIHLGP